MEKDTQGNLDMVRILLQYGVDKDKESNDNGATALHLAAYKG